MQIECAHLYISEGHNYYGRYGKGSENHAIVEKKAIELIAGSGILGDRFYNYKPDYKGQITFFNYTTFEKVRDEVANRTIDPSVFRRNVIVKGIEVESLIGKRFRLGELEFTSSCEAAPCFWMDEACGDGTHEFLKGQGGIRARITKGGILTKSTHPLEILETVPTDPVKN